MKRGQRFTSANTCRGAALLLAMIVLTLVATVAAGMVWQQSRAIEVEGAERARAQAGWILTPGVDIARDVLRRQSNNPANGDQPWDQPLEETRLSSLLAADRDNNTDTTLEATLSGRIADAQARYNLANLISSDGIVVPAERQTLRRLCDSIGLPGVDEVLVAGLRQARGPTTADASNANAAIAPATPDQLVWLGLDAATVARLKEFVEILPNPTPININSAPREVIYAVLDGIDMGNAARLVRQRNNRFKDLAEVKAQVPASVTLEESRVSVRSTHFHVFATLRYEDRALSEQALLQVRGAGSGGEVVVLRRERRPAVVAPPS